MTNTSRVYLISAIALLLLAVCTGLLVALIQERSSDVVRITVTSADMYGYNLAPTIHELECITGREAIAYRLNGHSDVDATKWRVVLEHGARQPVCG